MSKAILIMDMPESCSKCQFLYEFNGIKKCQLMNVLYNGASKVSQSKFTIERHHKCPLQDLPERKEENKYHNGTEKGYVSGYNSCIDEILKGSDKK